MRPSAIVARAAVAVLLIAASVTSPIVTPASACACGGFVSSDANASTSDEIALIHWDGRRETMIMQLALRSDTEDAALVVPTPTPAVASSANPELFQQLRDMTAPRVDHTWQWWPDTDGGEGSAGAPGAAGGAPIVLTQVQLGPIKATTLTGGDVNGLTSWLDGHGYVMRPEMLASLEPYSREGWSFVAMRLTMLSWSKNGCVALAVSGQYYYGWHGATRAEAIQGALQRTGPGASFVDVRCTF